MTKFPFFCPPPPLYHPVNLGLDIPKDLLTRIQKIPPPPPLRFIWTLSAFMII